MAVRASDSGTGLHRPSPAGLTRNRSPSTRAGGEALRGLDPDGQGSPGAHGSRDNSTGAPPPPPQTATQAAPPPQPEPSATARPAAGDDGVPKQYRSIIRRVRTQLEAQPNDDLDDLLQEFLGAVRVNRPAAEVEKYFATLERAYYEAK